MKENSTQLKLYFLDNLSPQELEEIDLQIISSADFAMELDDAETELLEDYLEGTLSTEDKSLFETKYLISDERRNKLLFLKSLKKFAKENPQNIDLPEKSFSFFEKLRNLFNMPKVIFVSSLLILLLVAGIVFQSYFIGNNSNDLELASLNQKDLSNPNDFKDWTNVTLVSDSLRSSNSSNRLDSKDFTENVFLRLVIPQNIPTESTFQVKLFHDNDLIFSKNNSPLYENQFGKEFRLIIPKIRLEKGEYQIELEKENSSDTKIIYNFTVR